MSIVLHKKRRTFLCGTAFLLSVPANKNPMNKCYRYCQPTKKRAIKNILNKQIKQTVSKFSNYAKYIGFYIFYSRHSCNYVNNENYNPNGIFVHIDTTFQYVINPIYVLDFIYIITHITLICQEKIKKYVIF